MKHGFKAWCERQAAHYRESMKFLPHDQLQAEKLAEYLDVVLVQPLEIPGISERDLAVLTTNDARSWSASTIMANGCSIVIYNPSHTPARHQANVMHELAHLILEHKPICIRCEAWFPCPLREFRQDDEEEAEWLGACLQIPRVGLEWALANGMDSFQIANHFGASAEMVRYRRNVTGIDRQYKRRPSYRR